MTASGELRGGTVVTTNRTDTKQHQAPAADADADALQLWLRWQRAGAGYFSLDDARVVVARLGQTVYHGRQIQKGAGQ